VSSCSRWPTHRLIIFKSQPFVTALDQGACRATSRSLCSLSTRRRVQFSTQLQSRGHRECSTYRGPNTHNIGLPSTRSRYGRSASCCSVDILSSFCTIFTGQTAFSGRLGTTCSEKSSRVEMADCCRLDERSGYRRGLRGHQGNTGISKEEEGW